MPLVLVYVGFLNLDKFDIYLTLLKAKYKVNNKLNSKFCHFVVHGDLKKTQLRKKSQMCLFYIPDI